MAKKYILCKNGNDYKANMHCHSTVSDGIFTPCELKEMYMQEGYSIIAYTDHDLFVPHLDLCDENFLALSGYEMEFYDYDTTEDFNIMRTTHLNMIALDPNLDLQPFYHRKRYFIGNGVNNKHMIKYDESKPDFVRSYTPECVNMVMRECKKLGFFVTYNHPRWSLENYEIYSKYDEMNALEILNGSSLAEGYIENCFQAYDDLLLQGKKVFAIAGDDNHSKRDSFWCWTVIRAKDLAYESVAKALKNGDFYATNGPAFNEIYIEDNELVAKTSDVKSITFSTNCRHAGISIDRANNKPVNEGRFKLNKYDKYVRITAFGMDGTIAYSNPYFIK
ncbi:MAG: hypothetical protein MJ090_01490 [Clostridia bacterium]|nr:hypothetical protein [Clostridia bacterium]